MWYNSVWGNLPLDLSGMSRKKLAKFENSVEFLNTFQQLYTAAMNVFKWDGLPETCDERMIERALLLSGRVMFVEMEGSILSLAGGGSSELTIYGYPVRGWGWGFNGFSKEFKLYVEGANISSDVIKTASGIKGKGYEAVLGYDNSNCYPFINYIYQASRRMTEIMREMDVVCKNLKQPTIITCDESMLNTVREVMNQNDSNVSAIISTGRLPIESFKVWDTKANPDSLPALRAQYEWIHNQIKLMLGLTANEQVDKRERLLVDEVNATNDTKYDNVEKRLVYRQRCADMVNEAFGTSISVSLRNREEVEDDVDPEGHEPTEDI